ncbi:MAG: ferredoxin-thioredoxin reductase catalytic domain-containing protein [Candidatus Hadarchaeales archaeon]
MEIEKLREMMEKYAKSQGYRLNPDETVTATILKGLLENEKKYGYRYCPCRVVEGDRTKDAPKICPCKWHKEEIEQMGHCHCGLFVRG